MLESYNIPQSCCCMQGVIVAIENQDKRYYGLQYHPEVKHTDRGMETLKHFLFGIAKISADWKLENILEEELEKLRRQVRNLRSHSFTQLARLHSFIHYFKVFLGPIRTQRVGKGQAMLHCKQAGFCSVHCRHKGVCISKISCMVIVTLQIRRFDQRRLTHHNPAIFTHTATHSRHHQLKSAK